MIRGTHHGDRAAGVEQRQQVLLPVRPLGRQERHRVAADDVGGSDGRHRPRSDLRARLSPELVLAVGGEVCRDEEDEEPADEEPQHQQPEGGVAGGVTERGAQALLLLGILADALRPLGTGERQREGDHHQREDRLQSAHARVSEQ